MADAQAEYAEAIAAAKEITDAEVPAYGEEAIAALSAVVTANTLDEAALRSRTAEEISAAAKAITDKIAEMDLEQAKADLNKIIAGVPAADEYTEESYAAVTEAVDAANELLASDEATVDALGEAGNAITAAVEKLVTKLEEAKAAYAEAETAANAAIEAAGEYAADEVAALKAAMAAEATTADEYNAKTEAVKAATEALNKAVEEAKKAKPQNVNATAGDSQVTVTWDKVDGAVGYAVYSFVDGKYTKIGSPKTNSFVANNLTNGTKYGFLVRAYVNGNWSEFTRADIVYATPNA